MSTTEQILEGLKNGQFSVEQAQEQLAQMKISDLKKTTFKVSPKGAISFYGIRRMPITLYRQELDQILTLTNSDEFKQFLTDNDSKFSQKKITIS
jgi:hypothetical protein